jgi:hypothetical protein
MVLSTRTKRLVIATVLIVFSVTITGIEVVLAPPSSSGVPMSLSQYGVVRLYANLAFSRTTRVTIVSNSIAPFFVEKIIVVLNRPSDFDILLDTIEIDGTSPIQITGYGNTPRVVVIIAGSQIGEVISTLPTNLGFLLSKDPLGNQAISVSGLEGSGMIVGMRLVSGGYGVGSTISAIALVTAPTNATISMTMGP